jgi:type II secretory pathway pseudopilin PulG
MISNRSIFLEILPVTIIIIVITAAFFLKFNEIKVDIRNNSRKGNIADIKKALYFYREAKGNFPISKSGACINKSDNLKKELESLKIIEKIPFDPRWPNKAPTSLKENNTPEYDATDFCYWYVSENGSNYYLSYFIEEGDDSKRKVITVSN